MSSQSTPNVPNELSRLADQVSLDAQTPAELFAVVDALNGQFQLRKALSNPTMLAEQRSQLAGELLGSRVGAPAMQIIQAAVSQEWHSGRELAAALEREAVRAQFRVSDAPDVVQDELFRFARTVAATAQLRFALANRSIDVAARRELVAALLDGKANPATSLLAQRGVSDQPGHGADFERIIDSYLELAAQLRQCTLAKVTTAQPLSEQQRGQLKAQLTRIYGTPIDLKAEINPSVLGGVLIEVGNEVIDGTTQAKLNDARRQLG